MRESLRRSLHDTPAKGFERYPKGSVVLCTSCSLPIAILDAAIETGEGAGRAASKVKPLSVQQVRDLASRDDIDAGVKAILLSWTSDQTKAHVAKLHEFRAGDPMICPVCGGPFVQVLAVDYNEVLDKAYTIEWLVIPPLGAARPAPIRGKNISATGGWVHEGKVH